MKPRAFLVVGSFVCLGVFGCGGDGRAPALPAGGKVLVLGKPAGGALVVFHPQDQGRENGPKPVATTNEDGTFKLTTYAQDDGAPAGEYLVTVVWNVEAKQAKFSVGEGGNKTDKLGGRFGNPKGSTLNYSVKKSDPNNFELDLK